jgi:hypothetical protein
VRPERFELPTFWFVARGPDARTPALSTLWLQQPWPVLPPCYRRLAAARFSRPAPTPAPTQVFAFPAPPAHATIARGVRTHAPVTPTLAVVMIV